MVKLFSQLSFLLLFALITCIPSWALPVNKMQLKHYDSENGLPQNSVKSVSLDNDGYIWIATEDGLVRFDGSNFYIYNRGNTPAFVSNRIIQVGQLANGILYCFDDAQNIFIYSRSKEWVAVPKKTNWQWIQSSDGSVYDLESVLNIPYNYALRRLVNHDRSDRLLYLPVAGNKSGFLSINKKTLIYLNNNCFKWRDLLPDLNIHLNWSIGVFNNHVYYLNDDLRLVQVDTNGRKRIINDDLYKASQNGAIYNYANVSLQQDGQDLFLQNDSVMYKFTMQRDSIRLVPELYLKGINNIFCYSRFPKAGISAIGTLTSGIYIFRPMAFKTLLLPNDAMNTYYAAVPMPDGGILSHLGTLNSTHQLPTDIAHVRLFSILRDKNTHYWVNVRAEEILELDSNLKLVRSIRSRGKVPVQCFGQTNDGRIWVSTSDQELGYVAADSMHWLDNFHVPSTTNILTFLPLNDSLLLMGGRGNLFIFHTNTGFKETLWNSPQRQARYFYKDKTGIIWIGTYGDGLFAWTGKKMVAINTGGLRGLNTVHALVEDNNGYFWLTTNNGLYQVKANDLRASIYNPALQPYFYYYDQADGFLTNEFNGACNPSVNYLNDGSILFPSIKGLVNFHPDSVHTLLPGAGVYIDRIMVDGQRLDVKQKIELPARFEYLEFKVSSPFFGNPNNQRLQYRLDGADNHWYAVPANGNIIFNHLPYGNYKLYLRKHTGFNTQNVLNTNLSFSVKPSLTETLFFRVFLIVAILALILILFRYRYRYLRMQSVRLQKEVAERTSDQQRLIAELKQSDRIKEKIMQVITHDMQSQLHFVSQLASRHAEEMKDSLETKAAETARNLKKATAEMGRFASNFGIWTAAYINGFHVENTTFPLSYLTEDLQHFFGEIIRQNQNELIVEVPENLLLCTDRQLLLVILRNLIDNANKHTRQGTIKLSAMVTDDVVSLQIEDTGTGMSSEQMDRVRAILNAPRNNESLFAGKNSRLGYQLIADFSFGLHVDIDIQSTPNKGTAVLISGIKQGLQ